MASTSAHSLSRLATRVFNTPLLIHPAKANAILAAIGARLGLSAEAIPVVVRDDTSEPGQKEYVVAGGIAIIPISGPLVKRAAAGVDAMSGSLTSYEELTAQIEDAAADPDVAGILFDVDSPGGEAAGMTDLSDFIFSLRGTKPMIAAVNDSAYSAAYGIASAADQVYITRDGGAGSIGCYILHCDQSGYNEKQGLKFEYIYAGDHKIDGNPMAPLSSDARESLQDEVDRIRDMFVSLVARNRSVPAAEILATQAECFFAAEAIPLLADKIGTLDEAMNAMQAALGLPDVDQPEPGDAGDATVTLPGMSSAAIGTVTVSDPLELKSKAQHKTALVIMNGIPGSEYAKDETFQIMTVLSRMAAERRDLSQQFGAEVISRVQRFPECRASAASDERRISMLVVPYESMSCDLGGFKEIYQRGCFSQGLSDDPRALAHHNMETVLGRQSAGTARFWEDAAGVHVECDAPETSWANDLLVSMRRGDITQASAAFLILQHRWEQRGGQRVRIVERALLREASVASFPAYESTQANVQPAPIAAQGHELELSAARLRLARVS